MPRNIFKSKIKARNAIAEMFSGERSLAATIASRFAGTGNLFTDDREISAANISVVMDSTNATNETYNRESMRNRAFGKLLSETEYGRAILENMPAADLLRYEAAYRDRFATRAATPRTGRDFLEEMMLHQEKRALHAAEEQINALNNDLRLLDSNYHSERKQILLKIKILEEIVKKTKLAASYSPSSNALGYHYRNPEIRVAGLWGAIRYAQDNIAIDPTIEAQFKRRIDDATYVTNLQLWDEAERLSASPATPEALEQARYLVFWIKYLSYIPLPGFWLSQEQRAEGLRVATQAARGDEIEPPANSPFTAYADRITYYKNAKALDDEIKKLPRNSEMRGNLENLRSSLRWSSALGHAGLSRVSSADRNRALGKAVSAAQKINNKGQPLTDDDFNGTEYPDLFKRAQLGYERDRFAEACVGVKDKLHDEEINHHVRHLWYRLTHGMYLLKSREARIKAIREATAVLEEIIKEGKIPNSVPDDSMFARETDNVIYAYALRKVDALITNSQEKSGALQALKTRATSNYARMTRSVRARIQDLVVAEKLSKVIYPEDREKVYGCLTTEHIVAGNGLINEITANQIADLLAKHPDMIDFSDQEKVKLILVDGGIDQSEAARAAELLRRCAVNPDQDEFKPYREEIVQHRLNPLYNEVTNSALTTDEKKALKTIIDELALRRAQGLPDEEYNSVCKALKNFIRQPEDGNRNALVSAVTGMHTRVSNGISVLNVYAQQRLFELRKANDCIHGARNKVEPERGRSNSQASNASPVKVSTPLPQGEQDSTAHTTPSQKS